MTANLLSARPVFPFRRAAAVLGLFCLMGVTVAQAAPTPEAVVEKYQATATRFITTATNSNFAFDRLGKLCDQFGPRLSGSTNLELAIDWVLAEMKKDGLQNVRGEEVNVIHWVRGEESVEMIAPRHQAMEMLSMGGSPGTPPEGITAEVLVVRNFDDLTKRGAEAKGKIVVFNQAFTTYDQTVRIRQRGAMEAAKHGAVASLIRSVTPHSLNTPHTGNVRYTNSLPQLPQAALTVEDAEMLQRLQDRGEKIVLKIKMNAQILPEAKSRNVVAEIVGSEKPEEIVIVSGHIDSWDVGTGAMDDAGGCLAAWEAVRLMKELNLRPRRTVRVVLWTNEENGIAGAKAYRDLHKAAMDKHILAIESDEGVFNPTGFAFAGSPSGLAAVHAISTLLKPVGATQVTTDAGGADVSKLQEMGVPIMDLRVDPTKYFWYHHTAADTMDKLDAGEFNRCVAAMTIMSYLVADWPGEWPR